MQSNTAMNEKKKKKKKNCETICLHHDGTMRLGSLSSVKLKGGGGSLYIEIWKK